MPYRCSKTFGFAAAHALTQLPQSHKCHNIHGHGYEVTITLEAPSLRLGMLVDFGDISKWWKENCEPFLDHRNLNEVPELAGIHKTAEALAKLIFTAAEYEYGEWVYSVRVQETPTCYAEYIRDDPNGREMEVPYDTFLLGSPDRLP